MTQLQSQYKIIEEKIKIKQIYALYVENAWQKVDWKITNNKV